MEIRVQVLPLNHIVLPPPMIIGHVLGIYYTYIYYLAAVPDQVPCITIHSKAHIILSCIPDPPVDLIIYIQEQKCYNWINHFK